MLSYRNLLSSLKHQGPAMRLSLVQPGRLSRYPRPRFIQAEPQSEASAAATQAPGQKAHWMDQSIARLVPAIILGATSFGALYYLKVRIPP